jgi:hypothetical protein
MASVKEKPLSEPMPAALEYLIRNMLDENVEHWRRQGYFDRLNSVSNSLTSALIMYQQQGKTRK